MDDDLMTQVNFALQKGDRDSDRLVENCLKQIALILNGKAISIDGKLCRIKLLGEVRPDNEDGKMKLTFDVKKPTDFLEHIEFTIKKTGWEMCLIPLNERNLPGVDK